MFRYQMLGASYVEVIQGESYVDEITVTSIYAP